MHFRQLARTAVIVGIAYVLSNLTGLGQRIIVTSRFGTSAEYDAFNAAFRIPELLFSLLAGGALASAFIPTFTARLSQNQQHSAWRLARTIAGLVFAFMSIVAIAAAVLAPFIIRTIVAPGFDDAQVDLTVGLMRLMLISTVIFGVSGLMMGVLQANNSFLMPAIAPSIYNFGIIFGALVLRSLGIYGVAIGVVLGAALHLLVQLPALVSVWRKSKAEAASTANEPMPELQSDIRNVIRLMGPRILGLGAVQVNLIVTVSLASGMGEGAVSALNIAFATLILPQAAIAQAIATVLFPTISAHAARGEREQFAHTLTRAINVVIALSAPAAIGLILLGQPIIRILFERNTFTSESTSAVAFALMWYGVGLVGHSVLEVVTRGFYALQDTMRPVILSVVSMAANIALSLLLAGLFRSLDLPPFGGLALANSIATGVETAVLYALLARRVPELNQHQTLVAAVKSSLATIVMAVSIWLWLSFLGNGVIAALVAIVAALIVYIGASWLLGSDETRYVLEMAQMRLGRRKAVATVGAPPHLPIEQDPL
ncbi:MAG TPA: murein biosynthesis integral membrane protein MurJ [Anaerolineae bacterium]